MAIVGQNGVGKTTLLRTLTGEITPTAGRVQVFGATPSWKNGLFRQLVSAGISEAPFAPDLTAEENLRLVSMSWYGTVDYENTPYGKLAGHLKFSGFGDQFPHELSSGQRQVLSLCMRLLRPMKLLILDEPEQRLDEDRIDRLSRVFHFLNGVGVSVVMATHSKRLAGDADLCLRLSSGAAA